MHRTQGDDSIKNPFGLPCRFTQVISPEMKALWCEQDRWCSVEILVVSEHIARSGVRPLKWIGIDRQRHQGQSVFASFRLQIFMINETCRGWSNAIMCLCCSCALSRRSGLQPPLLRVSRTLYISNLTAFTVWLSLIAFHPSGATCQTARPPPAFLGHCVQGKTRRAVLVGRTNQATWLQSLAYILLRVFLKCLSLQIAVTDITRDMGRWLSAWQWRVVRLKSD